MSAITLDLLNHLRKSGMSDEDARRIAQSFDKRADQWKEEVLREAKAHADRHRVETDERIKANAENAKAREAEMKAKFVSVDKYHDRDKTLATREDLNAALNAAISGVRAEISEIRKDIRALHRALFAVLIAVVGGFGATIAGLITIIGKLYFGS